MSERGVFAVDRGIWDHPVLASREPFTRREAWIWLISEAAWKARRRKVGSSVVELARGEIAHSLRFIADAWGWSKSSVSRFLDALKTETMIGTRTDHGVTIITICNYDDYQRVSLPDRDKSGTPDGTDAGHLWDTCGTEAGQQRDKLEDNKNNKTIEYSELRSEPPAAGAPVYTDSKHELWGEGIPILISLGVAEKQARAMIGSWMKRTSDDAAAVLGAIQRARDHRPMNPIPWITNALGGPDGQRNRNLRSNSAAGGQQSGSDAVLAGVAAAAERRARERNTAGRNGKVSSDGGSSTVDDPQLL